MSPLRLLSITCQFYKTFLEPHRYRMLYICCIQIIPLICIYFQLEENAKKMHVLVYIFLFTSGTTRQDINYLWYYPNFFHIYVYYNNCLYRSV